MSPEIQLVSIAKLKENDINPRQISSFYLDKLIESILVFSDMLKLRPIIVNKEFVILAGNMRQRALGLISVMDKKMISRFLSNQSKFNLLSDSEQRKVIKYWEEWKKNPTVSVRFAEFSQEQELEFMVKDNLHFGMDNYEVLKELYDPGILEEFTGDKMPQAFNYESINDEGLDVRFKEVLSFKFGKVEAILSDSEFKELEKALLNYINTNGSSKGFISSLL
jgi:hypothetical protein